ncbi:MAG TPA: 4Fe-4S binding protein [Methanocella sp.]|nr:4Fe-4S binding protein [Methanocella sp.]
MKIAIVYISPNKTTQKVSRELARLFTADNHTVAEVDLGRKEHRDRRNIDLNVFADADIMGFGSPVFHMKILPPMAGFLDEALPQIKRMNRSARAFVYLTYGGTTTGKSFTNMVDPLKRNQIPIMGGFKVCAPHFWHTENYPYKETLWTINDFYAAVKKGGFQELEWSKVNEFCSNQKPIIKAFYPLMGALRKLRGMPEIKYDRSNCVKCKKCLNECPVSAIEMIDFPIRDLHRCVYCYHCALACPKGAITYSLEDVEKRIEENQRIVGLERPRNAFYV